MDCGTERLRDFLSEAQPGGRSGPWVLPADPSCLSRPRIMAQPCVACVKTPWKDCSFCFSSPSCLLGPWPLSSAACPEPGPSSHPGQEGRGLKSWGRGCGSTIEPLLGTTLSWVPLPASLLCKAIIQILASTPFPKNSNQWSFENWLILNGAWQDQPRAPHHAQRKEALKTNPRWMGICQRNELKKLLCPKLG